MNISIFMQSFFRFSRHFVFANYVDECLLVTIFQERNYCFLME